MVALLRARASEEDAGRSAFVFLGDRETETGRLSFDELDRRARAIAVHLLKAAKAGERALLLFPPGLDFITAFFGCLYAGVVAVPVNPPSRKHMVRLRAIMDDAAPAVVMTTARLREQYQTQSTQSWCPDELFWLVTDELDLALAERWAHPAITPNTLAFLQNTSGSTGAPKGVLISHRNLLSNEAAIEIAFGHTRASNVVGWLPLYHDMGLIGNVLQPLFVGSTAILMPPSAFLEKPVRWLRASQNIKPILIAVRISPTSFVRGRYPQMRSIASI
jgi:acyl-CoA synthetase (AMP-forming)/AMP-acid ligase II